MTTCLTDLTVILLLHYLVNCRSHSLVIYNNEFILGSVCIDSKKSVEPQNHWKSAKIHKTPYFSIQGHWIRHQSRASVRLPISD